MNFGSYSESTLSLMIKVWSKRNFRNPSCAIKDHVVHRYQSQWVNLVQNYWEPPKLNDSIHCVAIWHSKSGFAPKYRILLSYLWFNLAMGAARQTAQRPIWIDFSSLTRATCHSGRIRIATFLIYGGYNQYISRYRPYLYKLCDIWVIKCMMSWISRGFSGVIPTFMVQTFFQCWINTVWL